MAGTLTVQNLQGPSSGANANKVLIPSGQTLDVSGGTLVPDAGAVVQCVQYYNASNSAISTTSTSLVASGISKTITPKYSNSLIIIQSSISMSYSNGWGAATMYLNGSAMTNAGAYHHSYIDYGNNAYSGIVFQGQYQATSTSALTFEIYYRAGTNTYTVAHSNSSSGLTLWEIKQ
jgi:hypothetical protein